MRISESTWFEVETWLERDDRCILPLGSTEQHAHLSLSVDSILSEKVAADAAEPLGVPVFPAVAYGLTPYFFRRVLIVNGHGGNSPVQPVTMEWMQDHPGARCRFHDWWRAPQTWAAVQATDPVASHASWMENFPWTRLPGRPMPQEQKPFVPFDRLRDRNAAGVRALIGDGNYGGVYQKPDEDMARIWEVAVAETRAQLEGDWA